MAWFGPKGVATMTFSLLVLADDIPGNERLFDIAALCVFASILAHGLTDTPGSEWLASRAEQPAPGRSEAPTPAAGGAPGGTRGGAAAAAAGRPDDRAGTSDTGHRS
jgi:NhaP-type Na+/H+ or K+/H+ antiporter